MAVDAVVALLDHPPAERRVEVRAVPLDDHDHRRNHPRQYVDLRKRVRIYERALNALIRGGAYYECKWDEGELARAVIELRSLALPPLGEERETWFSWPASDPRSVVEVRLDKRDINSLITGYYNDDGVEGMPSDAPIWLHQVWPRIVWERVVPAAVFRAVLAQSDTPIHVGLDDWVLSSRRPQDLKHITPPRPARGLQPSPWEW